jgi:hypothetical protein
MTSLQVNGTETWTDVSWVEKVLEFKRYLVVVYEIAHMIFIDLRLIEIDYCASGTVTANCY